MPPDGPRGGERYRDEWQPWLGILWDELDKNYWQEVVVTAPAQASKSFGALVVPTLRDVIHLGYSPIVGVPEADMFADKWQKDFRPVFDSSPELSRFLPTVGSGSRGGRVRDMVTFEGVGTSIKVMSRGGQATNKAGFTAPRLRLTEAAGFSEASDSDRDHEADAYRQLIARLDAFDLYDMRRLVLIEGTLTVTSALPWRLRGNDDDETPISTRSRLESPCPHCGEFISPERDHLVGWQTAKSTIEAYEQARFACPSCSEAIDDEQRRESMKSIRLVHLGQKVNRDGEVVGPMPATRVLWVRASVWHNLLKNIGTTAVKEWQAAQIEEGTQDRENAERDLCQKSWAIPYKSKLADNEPLDPKMIRARKAKDWQRGLVPHDTKFLAVGVDLGKWTGWWVVLAFREGGQIHVVAYGAFDVCRTESDDVESRLLAALAEFDESVIQTGFAVEGSDGAMIPAEVWVDMNYKPDTVAAFVRTRGKGWNGNRWKCCRGRGKSDPRNNGAYHLPPNPGTSCLKHGTGWHAQWNFNRGVPEITLDSDHWLSSMQDRLRAKVGRKGAMTLFRSDSPNEHARFSNHACADRLEKRYDPKKGRVVEEFRRHGDNHWGDGTKIALCAGDSRGFQIRNIDDVDEPEVAIPAETDNFYARMGK